MFFGLGKISKKSRLNKINKEFATQIGRIATQIAKGTMLGVDAQRRAAPIHSEVAVAPTESAKTTSGNQKIGAQLAACFQRRSCSRRCTA